MATGDVPLSRPCRMPVALSDRLLLLSHVVKPCLLLIAERRVEGA